MRGGGGRTWQGRACLAGCTHGKGGVHGRGSAYVAGWGMHGGGRAWQGGGHAWLGGMHGGRGHVCQGVCMVGKIVIAVGGTHPTGMQYIVVCAMCEILFEWVAYKFCVTAIAIL